LFELSDKAFFMFTLPPYFKLSYKYQKNSNKMALPKKKGIRRITVNDVQYYFTIHYDYYSPGLITSIGQIESLNKRFLFLTKCKDFWLEYPDVSIAETFTMTPKIVRQAIIFANEQQLWSVSGRCSYVYENNDLKKYREINSMLP
jgi:hypothetical protein